MRNNSPVALYCPIIASNFAIGPPPPYGIDDPAASTEGAQTTAAMQAGSDRRLKRDAAVAAVVFDIRVNPDAVCELKHLTVPRRVLDRTQPIVWGETPARSEIIAPCVHGFVPARSKRAQAEASQTWELHPNGHLSLAACFSFMFCSRLPVHGANHGRRKRAKNHQAVESTAAAGAGRAADRTCPPADRTGAGGARA